MRAKALALAVVLVLAAGFLVIGGVWYFRVGGPSRAQPSFYYLRTDGANEGGFYWSVVKANADGSIKTKVLSVYDFINRAIFVSNKQNLIVGGIGSVFPEVDAYDLANGQKTILYRDGMVSTSTRGQTCRGVVSGLSVAPDGSTVKVLRQDDYAFDCGNGEKLITFSWNGSGYVQTDETSSTSTDLSPYVAPYFSADHTKAIDFGGGKEGATSLGSFVVADLMTGERSMPLSGDENAVTSLIVSNQKGNTGYFAVNDAFAAGKECGMGFPLNGITIKALDFTTLALKTVYTASDTMSGLAPLTLSDDGAALLVRRSLYVATSTYIEGMPATNQCVSSESGHDLLDLDTAQGTMTPVASMSDWGRAHHTLVWENMIISTSTPGAVTALVVNGVTIDTVAMAGDTGILGRPFTYLGEAR